MDQEQNVDAICELRLCSVAEVEDEQGLRVDVDGLRPFAVFRVDRDYLVTDDTCSHGEASLSEGTVDGGQVECPWHSGRFCLKTGQALNFPAVSPIRVYAATVRDGAVFIHRTGESA
jgi:nitrite reductase/ring-hydroxylating ferredoxin subunit